MASLATEPDLLKKLGTSFQIIKAIYEAILRQGGTEQDLRQILRDPKLPDELAAVILGRRLQRYPIRVDYKLKLEEMIDQARLEAHDPFINGSNFPIDSNYFSSTRLEAVLLPLLEPSSPQRVRRLLNSYQLREVVLPELLAFEAQHPGHDGSAILALGSVWWSGKHGYVCYTENGRLCMISGYRAIWPKGWYVLAVPM
jgi:hypothetical protein